MNEDRVYAFERQRKAYNMARCSVGKRENDCERERESAKQKGSMKGYAKRERDSRMARERESERLDNLVEIRVNNFRCDTRCTPLICDQPSWFDIHTFPCPFPFLACPC